MVAAASVADSAVVHQVEHGGCLARMPVATFGTAFGAFAAKDTPIRFAYFNKSASHKAKPFHYGQRLRVLLKE